MSRKTQKKTLSSYKCSRGYTQGEDSYRYHEVSMGDLFTLEQFTNQDLEHMYEQKDNGFDEEIELLYEAIELLTDKQKQVILLWLSGNTQREIADELGTCQTNVHKSMHGNIDYDSGGKVYGGSLKKLKIIMERLKKEAL